MGRKMTDYGETAVKGSSDLLPQSAGQVLSCKKRQHLFNETESVSGNDPQSLLSHLQIIKLAGVREATRTVASVADEASIPEVGPDTGGGREWLDMFRKRVSLNCPVTR